MKEKEQVIYKAGEAISFNNDFEIELALSQTKKTVKKNDKAYLDHKGLIHYLSGEARGVIQDSGLTIQGVDYDNIANLIFNRLDGWYNLKDLLDSEEIDSKDFKELISDTLSDII